MHSKITPLKIFLIHTGIVMFTQFNFILFKWLLVFNTMLLFSHVSVLTNIIKHIQDVCKCY